MQGRHLEKFIYGFYVFSCASVAFVPTRYRGCFLVDCGLTRVERGGKDGCHEGRPEKDLFLACLGSVVFSSHAKRTLNILLQLVWPLVSFELVAKMTTYSLKKISYFLLIL